MMDIPIEVLVYLFKYLPHSDRLSASQTCKLWYEAICDKAFTNKQVIKFAKIALQNDCYPCNIYSSNYIRTFTHFSFEEMDMSNPVTEFWNENGGNIKSLKFDQCDMQEKVFVNIVNSCPNLEELTICYCRELFMSARLFEDLNENCLKRLKALNLPTNRYLSDALFHRLLSTIGIGSLQELDVSDCPVSFHPGLYKKFYPFGMSQDGTKTPSESVLTFVYILKILESNSCSIKKLTFNKTLIDGGALKAISEIPDLRLTHLYINQCDQLNLDGFMFLALHQQHLVELDIGKCSRVTDKVLVAIRTYLTNLKFLRINACKDITNLGVSELWYLEKLEKLDISENENITGDGIQNGLCREINYHLLELNINSLDLEEETVILLSEKLPNLIYLNANYCFASITDCTVQLVFENLVYLQSLHILKSQVSDVGLTGMGISQKLSTSKLPQKGNTSSEKNIHQISLRSRAEEEIVRDARRKQDVQIMCENILDETVRGFSISRLKNLTNLDISACNKITDVSLMYAFNFVQLKYLNLSECQQITHIGLDNLATNCPSLEVIELRNCFNTRDEGVKFLASKLHRLKHLNLSGCNLLTDGSLFAIRVYCKCLHFLNVQGCRNISPDVANSLSCIPTLHTVLISKPGPYVNEGQKYSVPSPPSLSIFAKFKRRMF